MAATDQKITYTATPEQIEAMHSSFDDAIDEVRGQLGQTHPMIIEGEEVTGRETFEVRAPANNQAVIGSFQKGTGGDVEQAIAAKAATLHGRVGRGRSVSS